jgi:hypothetical protein
MISIAFEPNQENKAQSLNSNPYKVFYFFKKLINLLQLQANTFITWGCEIF